MAKKTGNTVEVNLDARTVAVLDADGKVVTRYTPPAHVTAITFDPANPEESLSYGGRLPEEDQTPEGLARLAIEAALPSAGAVESLLGPARTGQATAAANKLENAQRDAAREVHERTEKERQEAAEAAEAEAKASAEAGA